MDTGIDQNDSQIEDESHMDDDDENGVLQEILGGPREPIQIIYVVHPRAEFDTEDLEENIEWGATTGMWHVRVTTSVAQAMQEYRAGAADLMILLGLSRAQIGRIARTFPSLPLSLAAAGGWDDFPDGFPPQVVVAQWAAPRPGEFQSAIEEALSQESLNLLYERTHGTVFAGPPLDAGTVAGISAELLSRLAKYPEERFRLDPWVFEETVAELLGKMGYEVRLTPRSGDKGRDVLAVYKTATTPILMLVECKRYAAHRLVGPEPVTRVWSRLFDDHANLGMVITTSGFAPIAHEIARSRGYQLSLKDGHDFIGWIKSLRTS